MFTKSGTNCTNSNNNKFVGYLISIESKNTFYQGVVNAINSDKGVIQLRNVFQNGLHCGNKLVDISTTNIDNIEILADPENALNILKPVTLGDITNNNSTCATHVPTTTTVQHNNNNNNQNVTNGPKTTTTNTSSNGSKPTTTTTTTVSTNSSSNNRISLSSTSSNTSSNSSQHNLHNTSTVSVKNPNANHNQNHNNNNHNYSKQHGNNQQRSHNHHHQHWESGQEENCFDVDTDDALLKDEFDFEKNLALFNKDEFYERVEGHSRPAPQTLAPPAPSERRSRKESPIDQILRSIHLNGGANGLVNGGSSHANLSNGSHNNLKDSSTSSMLGAEKYHSITLAALFSSVSSHHHHHAPPAKAPETTSSSAPTQTSTTTTTNGKNYRYDQMVIPNGEPVDFAQIQLPRHHNHNHHHYVTDDGFVVPCIDLTLRRALFDEAARHGLTLPRQIECLGRCLAEMAIQLVGGPIRFLPKNAHQRPAVLVLVNGALLNGAYALAAARLLALRSCNILVYVAGRSVPCAEVRAELALFESATDGTACRLVDEPGDLFALKSVDLILNGLESADISETSWSRASWFRQVCRYVEQCKASVLSVDPPSGGALVPKSKWCVVPVLPMAMKEACGRVYLADLGFTSRMFAACGVKYKSPFGAKFLIPLHDS